MDVEPETIVEELEEGEISDEDFVYTPLERPASLHNELIKQMRESEHFSDSDKDSISTESDSDSDSQLRSKKAKLKIKHKLHSNAKRNNKYNIWSSRAQEDILTETLTNCDVTKVDRSRDVESYNYPIRDYQNDKDDSDSDSKKCYDRQSNKRTFADRKNVKLRLGKRQNMDDDDDDDCKGAPRLIIDLLVTVDNTEDEIAIDIANKLCEEKDDLLKRVTCYGGKQKAIDIFNETKRIEANGGMLIMNRTRRRTPGGVYFFLLKHDNDLSEEQKKQIFEVERQTQNQHRRSVTRKRLQKNRPNLTQEENLPKLLTHAELCVREIAKGNLIRKESEPSENVTNPPPSPVTDGKENSSDEMGDTTDPPPPTHINLARNLSSYEDDFLDIGTAADMDIFS